MYTNDMCTFGLLLKLMVMKFYACNASQSINQFNNNLAAREPDSK